MNVLVTCMDPVARPSNFFDAHARIREARTKFLNYAEFRYRQFLSDPEQKPHAVACIHFNNWRQCRERFGFRGLEVLNRQIEERVLPELHSRDVCARFTDSALVLVLTANQDQRDIERWARSLLEILGDASLQLESHVVRATFGLGLCWFDRRVRGAEEALCDAIEMAEMQGEYNENRLRIFQPARTLDEAPGDERQIRRHVMEALETNRMRLVFQPLLSAESDHLRYYQAWARMISRNGEELRARRFLDTVRRRGELARLNRWTLRRATQFLATVRKGGNRIRLFVNVSMDTLDSRTSDWLERKLEQHAACRNALIAEFDEFDFANRKREVPEMCLRMRTIGVYPAVAGIGANSLSRSRAYLTDVDFMRMAPGFADEIDRNPALVNRFIDLIEAAHEHGVGVVMPELNSERQVVEFWKLGIDLIQGDYIEHPRALLSE